MSSHVQTCQDLPKLSWGSYEAYSKRKSGQDESLFICLKRFSNFQTWLHWFKCSSRLLLWLYGNWCTWAYSCAVYDTPGVANYTSCCKAIMVMTRRICCIRTIHAHPDIVWILPDLKIGILHIGVIVYKTMVMYGFCSSNALFFFFRSSIYILTVMLNKKFV